MADNDDFDDDDLPEIAEPEGSPYTAATKTLPQLTFISALTPREETEVRTATTMSLVVVVPSQEWIEPMIRAVRALGQWNQVYAGPSKTQSKWLHENAIETATQALASGGRTLAVAKDLDRLPDVVVRAADLIVTIDGPSDFVIRQTIKAATGKFPRGMAHNVADRLNFPEICAAIRIGSTPKRCVERLIASAATQAVPDPSLASVPSIDQLHGYGEAMVWAEELRTDLNAWRRGEIDFSAIDRNVVLASEPGLGKSTFVRSLAKSLGIPLFATSVSQWFANSPGYLDSVIKQIDEVFSAAASAAPAVVFLDEIEAIPNRATIQGRGDWWIPVVGHILLTLDSAISGVTSRLIVVGATNHPEKLDAALVRPGRLSRIISIGRPDQNCLEGIIRQHLGDDLKGASLTQAAELGVGGTGADVTQWVKTARRLARQENRNVAMSDLIRAIAPADNRSPDVAWRVAVHEASHAVVIDRLGAGRVDAISVVSRAGSGGITAAVMNSAELLSREEMEARVIIALAGRSGEAEILGSISTGAGGSDDSDLGRATTLVAHMHTSLGMAGKLIYRAAPADALRLVSLDPLLHREVEADLQRLAARATEIVRRHRDLVEAVARRLLKKRYVAGDEFRRIVRSITDTSATAMAGVRGGRNG